MTEQATYNLDVDWDANGNFTGTHDTLIDDGVVRNFEGYAVTVDRGRDSSRPLSPPQVGELRFTLNNDDHKYHPENSASALSGLLLPGRDVQFGAVYNMVTYDLFRGQLDELAVDPNPDMQMVQLVALDGLAQTVDRTLSTAVSQDQTIGDLIGIVLDEVGWPAGRRSLDTGRTVPFWWEEGTSAWEALTRLINSEGPGAALYVDGAGDIVFHDRHHRYTSSTSTTSQATFRDSGTEPVYSLPQIYASPWSDIVNTVTITVARYTPGPVQTVWSYPTSTVSLAASETRLFGVIAADPSTGLTDPVAGTDYTLISGSLTAATLDRTSGQSATLTLTAGVGGALLEDLSVRGIPWTVTGQVQVSSEDTASQTTYQRVGTLQVAIPWISSEWDAVDLAAAYVDLYKDPLAQMQIRVSNANATRFVQVLSRTVNDRITIVDDRTGMSKDFYIDRVHHSVEKTGVPHMAVLHCVEARKLLVASSEVFLLDDATQGKLGTGKLGW